MIDFTDACIFLLISVLFLYVMIYCISLIAAVIAAAGAASMIT